MDEDLYTLIFHHGEVHEGLRDFETDQDAHTLYASIRNVREIDFFFIQNEEEIVAAELANQVMQFIVSDEDDSEDEERDEDALELESDGLDDSDDAWVPGQDGDEHDDCTGDDRDAGEGGGVATMGKTVEVAVEVEAAGEVPIQEAGEEAREKGRERINRAEYSRVRRPKWRPCNALNRTTREEPSDHQGADEFVEETEYHSEDLQNLKGSDDESAKTPAFFSRECRIWSSTA
ncbi:hypothetical protein CRG98_041184 [Punica granatum]|uniref:Uncharacterized protein n=1 Tax=Punica granatum TaxID=22663 RepID=A0A2I0I344_PUNGR|nr:hypothetical protein CRG98_041184 [Punica granatum]